MFETVNIGNRRELFWDDFLIDTARTTAELKLHTLQPRDVAVNHDEPWEGDGCDFHCIVADDGLFRMYYLGWETMNPDVTQHVPRPIVVCYAESCDGKTWTKPDLGICEFEGSKSNNIILDDHTAKFDNFSVFKDTNSACPEDERYKGVGLDGNDHYLWCFTSADGIHFRKAWQMTNQGKFDTLNIALWDRHTEQYFCYIRDFHDIPAGEGLNEGIRDVRWMVSSDFKEWTTPILLDFGAGDDYPLYTNVVQQYYRADSMFVGFPSRYVEKKEWTSNFQQMDGADRRRKRMEVQPRYGLTITDCLFMSSRDGKRWKRWDEAFMTPGLEHEYNWVYGDCYPALGMIETESDWPHAPNELSMYAFDYHWAMRPAQLRRYAIRIDGFVSYKATYEPCKVTLRPFIFTGDMLSINFATSAAGYVKIRLWGGDTTLESIELFGDSLDRMVEFREDGLAALSGRPVEMEITMSDADIYSFQFR
jgi:hypothetical protein